MTPYGSIFPKLYSYQQEAVTWLVEAHDQKGGGCILADEMGLGKTVTTLAFLEAILLQGWSFGGWLLVVPATLINQWKAEINKWLPELRVLQYVEGDKREDWLFKLNTAQREANQVLITSYERARLDADELAQRKWNLMILDEGHRIRNPAAVSTLAIKSIKASFRLLLSGSPIQNTLRELWSLTDFVVPGILGSLGSFEEEHLSNLKFGDTRKRDRGIQTAIAIQETLKPHFMRRTKADVKDIINLPPKHEHVYFLELGDVQYLAYSLYLQTHFVKNAGERNKAKKKEDFSSGAHPMSLMALTTLKKICNHPDLLLMDDKSSVSDYGNPKLSTKFSMVRKMLTEFMETPEDKVLIFCQTVQVLRILTQFMETDIKVPFKHMCGETSLGQRDTIVHQFNEDPEIRVLLLTTRVGGVGLNLVAANKVIIFDPDYNPMTDVQARERAWRIGQQREVHIYRLILKNTIEEEVYYRQVKKWRMSSAILDDVNESAQKNSKCWRVRPDYNIFSNFLNKPPPPSDFQASAEKYVKDRYSNAFEQLDLAISRMQQGAGDPDQVRKMEAILGMDVESMGDQPDFLKLLTESFFVKALDQTQVESEVDHRQEGIFIRNREEAQAIKAQLKVQGHLHRQNAAANQPKPARTRTRKIKDEPPKVDSAKVYARNIHQFLKTQSCTTGELIQRFQKFVSNPRDKQVFIESLNTLARQDPKTKVWQLKTTQP